MSELGSQAHLPVPMRGTGRCSAATLGAPASAMIGALGAWTRLPFLDRGG